MDEVRLGWVDGGVGGFGPASAVHMVESGLQDGLRALAHPGTLVWGKNGEEDPILRQQVEGFDVHRGF